MLSRAKWCTALQGLYNPNASPYSTCSLVSLHSWVDSLCRPGHMRASRPCPGRCSYHVSLFSSTSPAVARQMGFSLTERAKCVMKYVSVMA